MMPGECYAVCEMGNLILGSFVVFPLSLRAQFLNLQLEWDTNRTYNRNGSPIAEKGLLLIAAP